MEKNELIAEFRSMLTLVDRRSRVMDYIDRFNKEIVIVSIPEKCECFIIKLWNSKGYDYKIVFNKAGVQYTHPLEEFEYKSLFFEFFTL